MLVRAGEGQCKTFLAVWCWVRQRDMRLLGEVQGGAGQFDSRSDGFVTLGHRTLAPVIMEPPRPEKGGTVAETPIF
jgi:hypothetical protein